ncbi:hypothetical protein [Jannaschia rubra]|nr:hypothetical protein [Jannaschia rubra]
MMRRAALAPLAVAALLLAPLAAPAQDVRVQSGEHAGFSRLVFAERGMRDWRIDRRPFRSVAIRFMGGLPPLDLSEVFRLIPRTRIRDLRQTEGALILDLGCDCGVSVMRVASGHIVVDVSDDGTLPRPGPLAAAPLLPQVIQTDMQPGPLDPLYRVAKGHAATRADGPLQVRMHPMGEVPLLPEFAAAEAPAQPLDACPIETLAVQSLQSDPSTALRELTGMAAGVLTDEHLPDGRGILDLSQAYLRVGWGAEASMVARMVTGERPAIDTVAAALDGEPRSPDMAVDPGCGPATALISLLLGGPVPDWDRADEPAFVAFLDSLPPARWTAVEPDLRAALRPLGREELLVGLGPAPNRDTEPPKDAADRAAGTDLAAIRAATDLLRTANARDEPSSETHLVNAVALLPSTPEGEDRTALEEALATAFVLSRRPAEAVEMVARGQADAARLVDLALSRLEPAAAAEFAVRLRPHLAGGAPQRSVAADLFRELGVVEAARGFVAPGRVTEPAPPREDGGPRDPWLARDLTAVAAVPEEDRDARSRLAGTIVAQNAAETPETDLARAADALDRSRVLSERIAALLATP